MKLKMHKGFTVLELLIVIGIICILMALILTGLDAARTHSQDEDKVTDIQSMVIGLGEYFDVCRQYPATLDPTTTCPNLQADNKTIADFIPNLATYNFNQSGSDYMYAGLTTDTTDDTDCTNFHIGVKLAGNPSSFASQKSNFNSAQLPVGMLICTPSGGGNLATGFDGTQSSVFDIKK